MTLTDRLTEVRSRLAEIRNADAAEARKAGEAEAREAARVARDGAAKQAVIDQKNAEVADLEEQIAEIEAQLEADRIATVWAEVNGSDGALTLWDRAEEAFAAQKAVTRGGAVPPMSYVAERTFLRATGVTVPQDLWQPIGTDGSAVSFAGLNFQVWRTADGGPVVRVQNPASGWQDVNDIADLGDLRRQNAHLSTEGSFQ